MWTDKVIKALSLPGLPVSRYFAHKKQNSYIVYAEDGSKELHCDNRIVFKTVTGTVDLFSRTQDDPAINLIEQGLNQEDIAFKLNSVQYEDDTGYIHHEWVFEVIDDG